MMKTIHSVVLACIALLMMPLAQAFSLDTQDKGRLQHGAAIYMNYCSGCHALRYLRYDKMAKDLGLTTFDGEVDRDLLFNNLVFTQAKINDPIRISLPKSQALQWFGVVPPDLSLIAREKGAAWVYSYLRGFYVDKSRPFGTNNILKPNVAMPNVLESLAGLMVRDDKTHLHLIKKGELSPAQFKETLQDLVTFLVYVAEPAQLERYRLGLPVVIFLSLLIILAWLLKRYYWRRL